jgi:hypothetical protein
MFGGILVLFIHITRLASNEIFSPSNKIHREVGRDKDLSTLLYCGQFTSNFVQEEGSTIHVFPEATRTKFWPTYDATTS